MDEQIDLSAVLQLMQDNMDMNYGNNDYNNAGYCSGLFKELVEKHKKSFQEIQDMLIKIDSRVRLCAAHEGLQAVIEAKKYYSNQGELIPMLGKKALTFYLFIMVNGVDEYLDFLKQLGIDDKQNYNRLAQSGFMTIKEY